MQASRRRILAVVAGLPAVALAGCTPSPTVEGAPAQASSPTPVVPTQPAVAKRATTAVITLQATVASAATGTWPDAPIGFASSLATIGQQCTAHLDRLTSLDPLAPDQERSFEPSKTTVAPMASYAVALKALTDAVRHAVTELRVCVAEAGTQPLRLLYASIAAASQASAAPGLAADQVEGSPLRFPDTTHDASVTVALTHVWALVNGLEVGLGRLPSKDPLRVLGTTRLDQVRQLRLDLRDALARPAEQDVAYRLPTPMRNPGEIKVGWAALELGVLNGLARLVASEKGADGKPWLDALLAQVGHVQAWGGKLPIWPGWTKP